MDQHLTDTDTSVADRTATGRVVASAAQVYEDVFVPALFGQWPERLLDLAGVEPGQRVLDVGCGTGIVARAAVDVVGDTGHVAGVDPNPDMLTVARRLGGAVEWTEAPAERLPYPDATFDVAVCQFALMFVDDRDAAVAELRRVLRPGGRAVVATWAPLDETPGYAAMVELLRRLFGDDVARALVAPFVLGDRDEVHRLVGQAFDDVTVATLDGVARFASVEAWVHTDVRGWTLADVLTDEQYELLLRAAQDVLARFVTDDGSVAFPAPAVVATATRR